jgi:hypothetical protein
MIVFRKQVCAAPVSAPQRGEMRAPGQLRATPTVGSSVSVAQKYFDPTDLYDGEPQPGRALRPLSRPRTRARSSARPPRGPLYRGRVPGRKGTPMRLAGWRLSACPTARLTPALQAYCCRVVLTNVASSAQSVAVLMQIPQVRPPRGRRRETVAVHSRDGGSLCAGLHAGGTSGRAVPLQDGAGRDRILCVRGVAGRGRTLTACARRLDRGARVRLLLAHAGHVSALSCPSLQGAHQSCPVPPATPRHAKPPVRKRLPPGAAG